MVNNSIFGLVLYTICRIFSLIQIYTLFQYATLALLCATVLPLAVIRFLTPHMS